MPDQSSTASDRRMGPIARIFPWVVVIVAVGVLLAAHYWPRTDVKVSDLNLVKMATVLFSVGLLFLWTLRYSGLRRRNVWIGAAVMVAVPNAIAKVTSMDGDFFPIVEWREWFQNVALGGSADRRREQARAAEGTAPPPADLAIAATDWAEFRGPNRDGIVSGVTISGDWDANPPREVWRKPIGGGYAAFSAVGGYLFTIEQRRDEETVVCYEAASGKEVWASGWKARFSERLGGDGPRATPTVADGDVYAYGALGKLACLDGKSGVIKWSVDTLDGNQNIPWAMSGSPLVVGDIVVVNPGSQVEATRGKAVRAYDRKSGKEVWSAGNQAAGYSSPQSADLGGRKQILVFDARGLGSYDPTSGKQLWYFGWPTYMGINVAQPLVLDAEHIFFGAGYGAGSVKIRVTRTDEQWKVEEVWRTKSTVMQLKFMSGVRSQNAAGDFYFGLNDGKMECIDLATGKMLWRDDRRGRKGEGFGHGQLLRCGDRIIVLTEFGELVLLAADPKEMVELGRIMALPRGPKTWNNPAIANGVLYIRNEVEMACYDLTNK